MGRRTRRYDQCRQQASRRRRQQRRRKHDRGNGDQGEREPWTGDQAADHDVANRRRRLRNGIFQQFGRDRFLSTPLMKWMYDMYIADPGKRKDIHASPLRASIEELKGLPPALIQVAENDILRDEGEAYGRKLDEAGVEVTTIRYDGMIHDFGLLNALANEPATRSLFRHAAAELKNRLQ